LIKKGTAKCKEEFRAKWRRKQDYIKKGEMNWTCNTYCRRGRKEEKNKQTERQQNVQEEIRQILL
jgi:hypothetical protein